MASRGIPVSWCGLHHAAVLLAVGAFGTAEVVAQGQAAADTSAESVSKCRGVSSGRDGRLHGPTLADALQGKIPGVTVTAGGGGAASGAGVVRIRGTNSLQSNAPLLFIDDVRVTALPAAGPRGLYAVPLLEFVDVSQIEHIQILRGPAATLRYGQGASAGVIRIYTRRGRRVGGDDEQPKESDCPTP